MAINWDIVGPLLAWLLATGVGLAGFGLWFNGRVKVAHEKWKLEGIDSLMVAIGTGVTLVLAYPLLTFIEVHSTHPPEITALLSLLAIFYCFVASGAPMIYGSVSHFIALKMQKDNHDATATQPGQ